MRSKALIGASLFCACLVCATLVVSKQSGERAREPVPCPTEVGTADRNDDESDPLRSAVRDFDALIPSASIFDDGICRHPAVPIAPESDDREFEWPGDYPRTDFSLASYFFTRLGDLDAGSLIRHVELNVADRPVSPDLVAELTVLVDLCNERLTPLEEAYRDVKMREMAQQVETGKVPAEPDTAPPDRTLATIARSRLRKGQYPGKTVEDVVAELRRGRMKSVRSNGIVRGGKVYLEGRFEDLPSSDSAFEALKFVVFESLVGFVSWFESHGLTNMAHVRGELARLEGMTRRDLDIRWRQR